MEMQQGEKVSKELIHFKTAYKINSSLIKYCPLNTEIIKIRKCKWEHLSF